MDWQELENFAAGKEAHHYCFTKIGCHDMVDFEQTLALDTLQCFSVDGTIFENVSGSKFDELPHSLTFLSSVFSRVFPDHIVTARYKMFQDESDFSVDESNVYSVCYLNLVSLFSVVRIAF